jgi:hypothetical protein
MSIEENILETSITDSIHPVNIPTHLYFVIPVWGEYHTKVFTEVVLPSYLSPNNLPACKEFICIFEIHTDKNSADIILQSPYFDKLKNEVKEIRIEYHDFKNTNDKIGDIYNINSQIHHIAIKNCASFSPAIFFLNADTIYSNGSFKNAIKLLRKGYRSIELVTPRISGDSAVPILQKLKKTNNLSVSPEKLTEIGLNNLHTISHQHFWDNPSGKLIPDNLYWNVEDEGILARCTHLHPFMVYPRNPASVTFSGTIDHDLIDNSIILKSARYVSKNNHDICAFEISPNYHSQCLPFYSSHSHYDLANFLTTLCTKQNKENLKKFVQISYKKKIDKKKWKETEELSSRILNETFQYIREGYLCKPLAKKGVKEARLLIPVWGDSYIDKFFTISLRSLLAEGNLNYLNDNMNIELIFLTNSKSISKITETLRSLDFLRKYSVSFISIDDIINLGSHYGVILTMAYTRGIKSLKEKQTSTYFFFLNSDFIISKNTYKNIYKRIEAGYSSVLISSLRAKEEVVLPILLNMINENSGLLSVSSREFVELTLKNLHNTASANIVNGHLSNFIHHDGCNQMFYRVDQNTLIGRFFLLFMACIKPEVPFKSISGFCDYTFIADLCPSKNYSIITDSDEGFVLELQKTLDESSYLKLGGVDNKERARILSKWTNHAHREFGEHNIVIHSKDLPKSLHDNIEKFNSLMSDVYKNLSPVPKPVKLHHYWIGCLQNLQAGSFQPLNPLPLNQRSKPSGSLASGLNFSGPLDVPGLKLPFLLRFLSKMMFGTVNSPTLLHPLYKDISLIKKEITALINSKRNILVLRPSGSHYDYLIHDLMRKNPKCCSVTISSLQALFYDLIDISLKYDSVILINPKSENLFDDIEKIHELIGENGELDIIYQNNFINEDGVDFLFRKNQFYNIGTTKYEYKSHNFVYGQKRLSNLRNIYHELTKNKNKENIFTVFARTKKLFTLFSKAFYFNFSRKIEESLLHMTTGVIKLKKLEVTYKNKQQEKNAA